MQAFISIVLFVITNENTFRGMKVKFVPVVRSKVGKTITTQDSHGFIIWFGV